MDRENVIKRLEICISNQKSGFALLGCSHDGCTIAGETCVLELMDDALALLKAQEPRVMTLEELEDWDGAVYFEAFETDAYYALIENVELTAGMDGEYVLVNVVPGEHHRHIWGGEHYGSIWRCWTSRPDQATREATPWN